MNLIKKLLPLVVLCSVIPCMALAQTQGTTTQEVVTWMYENGLTVFSTSAAFHPERSIRRDEAAKFIAIFAQNILGQSWNPNPACHTFNDVAQTNTLKDSIVKACELWYIKGSNRKFSPSGNLTNEQAIAIVIRTYEGLLDEPQSNRSKNYYSRATELGISDGLNLSNKTAPISRWTFATLVYRVSKIAGDAQAFSGWDTIAEAQGNFWEGFISALWFKINSYSWVTNDFINKAGTCYSWAAIMTDAKFDMFWVTFHSQLYRQIRWLEWNQCKIYERMDVSDISMSTGQIQSAIASGAKLSEITTQLAQMQASMQKMVWEDDICIYTTWTLVKNLQAELSGEITSMLGADGQNCTWTLYQGN